MKFRYSNCILGVANVKWQSTVCLLNCIQVCLHSHFLDPVWLHDFGQHVTLYCAPQSTQTFGQWPTSWHALRAIMDVKLAKAYSHLPEQTDWYNVASIYLVGMLSLAILWHAWSSVPIAVIMCWLIRHAIFVFAWTEIASINALKGTLYSGSISRP